jgi:phytoene dehydrogenase-like protein
VQIGDAVRGRIDVHLLNHDPTLALSGKTTLTVMLNSDHAYWQALTEGRAAYRAEKDAVADAIIAALDQRWPGLADQVEMVDIATPLTFEGWMLTPQNANTVIKPLA